jgi:trigger factor
MQITVETVGLCRKRIQLFVPPERIREEVNEYLKNAAGQMRVPGFRQGHVPRNFVEKRYGAAIRKDVKESLVNDGYQQAVKEHNLQPLTAPHVDLESIPLDEEKGLKVDFEIDTRPEFEPKDYKGIDVKTNAVTVSNDDVENQLKEIRNHSRRPVKDESAPITDDTFAIAALEFRMGDKVVLQRDSVRVRPGMTLGGADAGEFTKLLSGKKVGESFEMELTFPEEFEVKEAVGQKGQCKVTIREVYKLVAPSDEEVLKELDMPDMDTLKKDLTRRITEARDRDERRRVEEELIEAALEKNKFEIPDRIIDQQVESRLEQQNANAESPVPPEEVAKLREKMKPDMDKGLRRLFLLEAIAKKEKVFVTEDDLMGELRSIAERNQSTVEEVARYYQQQNLLPAMRLDLLETKVRNLLYESAKRTPASA